MYCEWIIDWFINQGVSGKDELNANINSNFFEKEYIDSFLFIKLISDIEDEFGITFDNEQFQDRNFSTIAGMGECIENCVKKGKDNV